MKKIFLLLFFPVICLLASCSKDDPEPTRETEKTVLMYLPWSSNLTRDFERNINDIEECIMNMRSTGDSRVLVFFSKTDSEAELFEIAYTNGACSRIAVKSYTNPDFTTVEGLSGILTDAMSAAPAKSYAMIVGGHGMGWLPVSNRVKQAAAIGKAHWEYDTPYPTRYFGGTTAAYQTNISTLAKAINRSVGKMEYILFDNCYMACIEVAYELRNSADYLIASSTEILARGMPYTTMGRYLIGKTDYEAACRDFYSFYSTYSPPCGVLATIDLSQVEEMAQVMAEVNDACPATIENLSALQRLDGYFPTIFFDYGDYARTLMELNAAPQALRDRFEAQLKALVPYSVATDTYYTAAIGRQPLNTSSGLSTSTPSLNPLAESKTGTAWYKATH